MPKIILKENGILDGALRRLERQVSRNETLAGARKGEFYVRSGVHHRLKSEATRKTRRGR